MSKIRLLEVATRRANPKVVVDAVAAAALAVATVFNAVSRPHPYAGAAFGVVLAGTVAFRRRSPVAATLTAGLAATLSSRAGVAAQAATPIVFLLDYYMVGRQPRPRGSGWIDVVLLLLPVAAVATDPNTSSPGNSIVLDTLSVWAFFFAFPYAGGRALGSRESLNAALRLSTRRLEQQQRERERQAVVEERMRIARELHDVVAHSVSVMVIQTAAARAVAARDASAAVAALRSVESCGRDALADMRRMIGVLHRSDIDLLDGAAPGLSQLEQLLNRARASGLSVELSIVGEPKPLPPALDLMVYRIVQEALTNVMKHAGQTRALVRIAFTGSGLTVEILDSGRGALRRTPPQPPGHGLAGMRERLSLYDGELTAGARIEGGYQVLARIPLPQAVNA